MRDDIVITNIKKSSQINDSSFFSLNCVKFRCSSTFIPILNVFYKRTPFIFSSIRSYQTRISLSSLCCLHKSQKGHKTNQLFTFPSLNCAKFHCSSTNLYPSWICFTKDYLYICFVFPHLYLPWKCFTTDYTFISSSIRSYQTRIFLSS